MTTGLCPLAPAIEAVSSDRWRLASAYLYVCGDAKRMAKDVHQTLIDIAHTQGALTPEAAAAYVNDTLMKKERRYLRDVY